MSTGRDDILANIRRSLGVTGDEASRRRIVAGRLAQPQRGVVPQRGQKSGTEAIATFRRYAEAVQTSVSIVASAAEVPAEAARWLAAANLPARLRMGADQRLAAMPWPDTLLEISHGASDGGDLNGISHARAGIIETGSVVLTSGPDNPTTLNFLPDNHIVVLDGADLVPAMEDVWTRLRAEHGGAMPRVVNQITGPSRSGDIDRTIFLGAHGPRALHVIIVDADAARDGAAPAPAEAGTGVASPAFTQEAKEDGMSEHKQSAAEKAADSKALDESLEESFPASDPSSVTRAPLEKRYQGDPAEEGPDKTSTDRKPAGNA